MRQLAIPPLRPSPRFEDMHTSFMRADLRGWISTLVRNSFSRSPRITQSRPRRRSARVQVKDTTAKVTINSEDVRDTLDGFVDLVERNPGRAAQP